MLNLVDVSDIFYFFCSGKGNAESEVPWGGRGDRFFIENPRRGGGVSSTGGAEGPGGCLWQIWGGGLNIFFGAEMSAK